MDRQLVDSAEAYQPRVARHFLAFLGRLVQEAGCWVGGQLLIAHPDKQRVRVGLQAAFLLNMLQCAAPTANMWTEPKRTLAAPSHLCN